MPRNQVIEQVRKTIRRYKMLRAGDRVLVAVSGGPDSVALLHLLVQLQRELGPVLAVAHLDHRMRQDSHLDCEFAQQLAARFSLPFFSENRDVPGLVKASGGNLEEVARLERRAFLELIAQREHFSKIATGHTMDDQAETVLMNLLRGSGSAGLGGIAPQGGKWVRPIIEIRRAEILEFLKGENAGFCEDPTNVDTRFLRNRIRHQLLPLLQTNFSPGIVGRLAALAEMQRATATYWRRSCRRWIRSDSTGLFVAIDELRRRPVAEQRETIRLLLWLARGSLRRITFQHTESVRHLLETAAARKKVTIPGGWEVRNVGGMLRALRRMKNEE